MAYEVGTQAQWVADIVQPLALDVQVANPSRIPWLSCSGKKNDRADARKLATLLYLGQLPTVHLPSRDASGLVDHHGHIRKRGPSVVRWVLIQATYQTVGRCPAFRQFFARIHRGKKDRRKKAIVAAGRKLLTICYAMMRDQVPFDPSRVQRRPA